ncbi:MAG: molybdenum cofactor guanylyltransferase MobA [Alphaproteobacteria bacterium]|nr:molybdenum cofactor guanylyltransferase MobA [Alphaproteobacteria bacterium]
MRIEDVAGVILTGGRSLRMGGGDKCLLPLAGRPLLAHIVSRAAPQVSALALNANGDPARFAAFGLTVVADDVPGFPGPLAGILAGMEWVRRERPGCRWLASFPGDAPLLPPDLVERLALAAAGAEMACAASGGRDHPVVGLWPVALASSLRHAIEVEDIRKITRWTGRFQIGHAEWPADPVDPFFNVNTPDDLSALERLVAG